MLPSKTNILLRVRKKWNILSNGPYLQPEVRTWVNNIEAAGSGVSPSTIRAANKMVTQLKSAGLWGKILMHDPCAGNDLTASLVRLKVPAGVAVSYTNYNFVSADYTETGANGGRKGDGATKYLDSLINEKSLGFDVSSTMHFWYWRDIPIAGTSRCALGSQASPNNNYSGWLIGGSTNAVYLATTTTAAVYSPAAKGFLGGGTNGSRVQQMYGNGNPVGTPGIANGDFPNCTLFVAANNNNSLPTTFSNFRTTQIIISKGLSDYEAKTLYSIVQQFETALGRNV